MGAIAECGVERACIAPLRPGLCLGGVRVNVDIAGWIDEWCQRVVGKPCWMVRVGGCTGSRFTLDLGAKIPRIPVRWNPAYSAEANENHGEYWLHVGCANWAFGIDRPGERRIITDSSADCSPNGPMVAGLENLIGNTVKSVTIDAATFDLNMYFEEWNLRLKVFGDVTDEQDGYRLGMPERIVCIDGPQRVTCDTLD